MGGLAPPYQERNELKVTKLATKSILKIGETHKTPYI